LEPNHDAFSRGHARRPRGKGHPDGALHEIPPVQLVTQLLEAVLSARYAERVAAQRVHCFRASMTAGCDMQQA